MTADLLTTAAALTAAELAALKLISTWYVKKIGKRWNAPVKRVDQAALTRVQWLGLARVVHGPRFQELVLTGLGSQVLALKTQPKSAAPSFQERSAA